MSESKARRRIGIVGYGKVGQFLAVAVLEDPALELAFVWNRKLCLLVKHWISSPTAES